MQALRPYQTGMLTYSLESIQQGVNSVLCAPTGTGKSIVIMRLTEQLVAQGYKVLLVAPSRLLVDNLAKYLKLTDVLDIQQGFRGKILAGVFLSVANRLPAILEWIGESKAVILHDECHHSAAKQWQKIIKATEKITHIGFSATPLRLDGKPLDGFQRCKVFYSIPWFIDKGYLAPLSEESVSAPDVEANLNDLEAQFSKFKYQHPSYLENWKKYALLPNGRHKPTLIYGTTIEHCQIIEQAYNAEFPDRFLAISSKNSEREINQALACYQRGELWGLINVQLLTEGVDAPATKVVQMCRATSSITLLWQMVGRALRVSGDTAVVLDHAGNLQRLGSVLMPVNWEYLFNRFEEEKTAIVREISTVCPVCKIGTLIGNICDNCGAENIPKAKPLPGQRKAELASFKDSIATRIAAIRSTRSFRQREIKLRGLIHPGISNEDFGLVVKELAQFGMSPEVLEELQELRGSVTVH